MNLSKYYNRKNILIFGASQGIGNALAFELSNYDCQIWVASRNEAALQKICEEINLQNTAKAAYSLCDVKNKSDVQATVDRALSEFGSIDIAVLNAGISGSEGFDFNSDVFKRIYDVNVFGVLHGLDCLIPVMKDRGGIIAATSSLADARGIPGSGAYTSSKAAVSFILEAVKFEVIRYNIRVLTIKPGFVETNMTAHNSFPMPFKISSKKAATHIIKGIAKEKSIIAFPFATHLVSYIGRRAPNWLFNLIFNSKNFKF